MDQVESGAFADRQVVSKQPDVIRVVSWNIARGCEFDRVTEFLLDAKADVVILQETDRNSRRTFYRNIAKEISQKLGMNYVFGIEFQELGQGSHESPAFHGQATLSPWPMSKSSVVRFRRQSKFWHPFWFMPKHPVLQRRLGGRIALRTQVSIANRNLAVYNLHLESRREDALRCAQLVELLEDANQYSSNLPVIAAGDFNFDITRPGPSSAIAEARFSNPFSGMGIQTTRPPRFGQGRAVDWILVRGILRTSSPQVHSSVTASDHYPLSLHLQLPPTAQDMATSPDNLCCPNFVVCPH
ncbi:MAG TPA: endonuclease/exonuclease/phosphatase family protein [Terriglobales bacterium]|nr:endonuclease/exonuclease/phosphatase family protein [Terriglobales bacterium]